MSYREDLTAAQEQAAAYKLRAERVEAAFANRWDLLQGERDKITLRVEKALHGATWGFGFFLAFLLSAAPLSPHDCWWLRGFAVMLCCFWWLQIFRSVAKRAALREIWRARDEMHATGNKAREADPNRWAPPLASYDPCDDSCEDQWESSQKAADVFADDLEAMRRSTDATVREAVARLDAVKEIANKLHEEDACAQRLLTIERRRRDPVAFAQESDALELLEQPAPDRVEK